MKKTTFFLAFAALLLANILVYSCQKERPAPTAKTISSGTAAVTDRTFECPEFRIGNGMGLLVCGTDNGTTACVLCDTSTGGDDITTNPQNVSISGKFGVYNPTAFPIMFTLYFGCTPQTFTVPAGGKKYFAPAYNPSTGCCTVTEVFC